MTNELIRTTKTAGVATFELNNPPANAYSYDMFRALDEAILDARMDDDIHVIVLTGAGERFFCAGADIGMLEEATPTWKYSFCLHANETLLRLENTPKLVIAAIAGHCVGGGLEVALAADLRIAKAGGYKLGLPEAKLGVLPGTGGTQRLSRALGAAKALELMIDSLMLSPSQAAELGLLHRVLETDSFLEDVQRIAESYAPPGKASRAIGYIKRAVVSGAELPLAAGLSLERELQQRLFEGNDAREGLMAFRDGRNPSFKGD